MITDVPGSAERQRFDNAVWNTCSVPVAALQQKWERMEQKREKSSKQEMPDVPCDLKSELERCEADTLKLLGQGAAIRLATWQKYDGAALINFVRRVIRGNGRLNGWELHKKGGRSLEQIVIDCGLPMFTDDDILEAKKTLQLA